MSIFTLESTHVLGDGRRKWMNIETQQQELVALATDLRGGPVVVQQLFCRAVPGEAGTFEVVGRRPLLITTAYVFAITVPENRRFVEFGEAADA